MTREDAVKLMGVIPRSAFSYDAGVGEVADHGLAKRLKELFPQFNWRIALNRQGEYSRWMLTIDDPDIREHYVPVGGTCIHCGKSARELGVEERFDD